jgi:aryl-alcohol dehydrogenase-like predicted oxidoreductase
MPDQSTPLDETLGALDELVDAGKVREIGCSNFSAEMIDEATGVSRSRGIARFVSVQNEYSLLRRGPERQGVLDACARDDLAFIPYFPLASGVLTGKYTRGAAPPDGTRLAGMPDRAEAALSDKVFDRVEALDTWARDNGHTLLELAFAWLLARPVVASVIAGATRVEQVQANAAAARWQLSESDQGEIEAVIEKAKSS